jgi:hypothetical protein
MHGYGAGLLCVVNNSLQEVHITCPPLNCEVQYMRHVLEFLNNLDGLGTE